MLTLNEDLFDDVVEIEIPDVEIQPPLESPDIELAGPDPGQATGEASLILNAISDCAKTIDNYNMMKANLSSSEAGNIIDEIASEETVILGKLQALLKQVSPNAECIPDAIEGAEEVLGESLKESIDNNIISKIKEATLKARKANKQRLETLKEVKSILGSNGRDFDKIADTADTQEEYDEFCKLYDDYLYAVKQLNTSYFQVDSILKTYNDIEESLNESKKDKLEKEIFEFLDDCGGYSDYNQKVEDVMDEWNLDRDTAEGYVWDWSLKYEDDLDKSLKEDTVLYSGSWGDEDGNWQLSTLHYKGFRLKVNKDNLINIYDKHGELVDYGFKTKKSAIDAIDSGEYDGLNESKLNEGDWEDPEWRKYWGVDDDSFYDEPVPQPMDIDDYDIDDTFEESFKETSKFLDPTTGKLKVEAWEPVEQSQEEPNKIDDQIPDDMEVDDEF